jgi:hypothetical protein
MSDDPKKRRSSSDPDDTSRWRRPEDRFPALPQEEPPTAPLKEPPRPRPAPPVKRENAGRNRTINLITLFFLLASCGAVAYFAFIWNNYMSPLNPLAPPTPMPVLITATLTQTLVPSPTATLVPSLTFTPSEVPTEAPTATFTPVFLDAMETPASLALGTPESTEDVSNYRFSIPNDLLIYITNPEARGGCDWLSIAGSVMNADGTALNGYGVRIAGEGIDQTVATGSAPGFGPGGFEVRLGSEPKDARYVAQLLDSQGVAVSPVYTVVTKDDCSQNIVALRFEETAPSS